MSECVRLRTTSKEQGLIGVDECGDSDPVATAPGSDAEQVECGDSDPVATAPGSDMEQVECGDIDPVATAPGSDAEQVEWATATGRNGSRF